MMSMQFMLGLFCLQGTVVTPLHRRKKYLVVEDDSHDAEERRVLGFWEKGASVD